MVFVKLQHQMEEIKTKTMNLYHKKANFDENVIRQKLFQRERAVILPNDNALKLSVYFPPSYC